MTNSKRLSFILMLSFLAGIITGCRDDTSDLEDAIMEDNLDEVKSILVKKPELINTPYSNGYNLIHRASYVGSAKVITYLISQGAPVNVKESRGYTPLHFAAEKGHVDVAKILISNGANVNAKNKNNQIPLHLASYLYIGQNEVIEFLISKGSEINAQDELGNTPLHNAALNARHQGTIQLLLAAGANPNAMNKRGTKPIEEAFPFLTIQSAPHLNDSNRPFEDAVFEEPENKSDKVETVKILLSNGADANTRDSMTGQPLLLRAAFDGEKDLVEAFLNHGADPNAKGNDDVTALHLAAWRGHKEIVEFLLKQGVDVNAETKQGSTPLFLAQHDGHTEIADLLRKHGAVDKN